MPKCKGCNKFVWMASSLNSDGLCDKCFEKSEEEKRLAPIRAREQARRAAAEAAARKKLQEEQEMQEILAYIRQKKREEELERQAQEAYASRFDDDDSCDDYDDDDDDEGYNPYRDPAYWEMRKRHEPLTTRHHALMEKIGVAYSIAVNLTSPFSAEMEKVIELCKEDISLAMLWRDQLLEELRMIHPDKEFTVADLHGSYPSFKRLAIIYEKRKEYQKAIDVCEQAISLGYTHDGTEGQMPGRIARLMKKQRQALRKIDT